MLTQLGPPLTCQPIKLAFISKDLHCRIAFQITSKNRVHTLLCSSNSMTLHDLFSLSKTLGLAVIFKNFKNFPCFRVFLDLKQFNGYELWRPPKCVPFVLFILHCPCLVIFSNWSVKHSLNFPWLSRTNN